MPARGIWIEQVDKRTRNGKKCVDSANPRYFAVDASIGSIHYKDNPKDEAEQWKEIDTAISPDGKVRAAPYDLDIYLSGMPGFHYKSKESGEFDVRLKAARTDSLSATDVPAIIPMPKIEGNKVIWENIYPDTDVILVCRNTKVILKRILKTDKAPLEYDVDIQEVRGAAQLIPLSPAIDANGQRLAMKEKSITGGRTETLRLEVIEEENEVKPIKYPIEDATEIDEIIADGADDDRVIRSASNWQNTGSNLSVGYWSGSFHIYGSGMRFTGINIPADGVVTVADFTLVVAVNRSPLGVFSDICCENSNNPGRITSYADHIGRARTTGIYCLHWDDIPAWQTGQSKQSPDFAAAIQKVVDDQSGTGDALIVFWEDKDNESNSIRDGASENNTSYDPPSIHIEYTEEAAPPAGQPYISRVQGVQGMRSWGGI